MACEKKFPQRGHSNSGLSEGDFFLSGNSLEWRDDSTVYTTKSESLVDSSTLVPMVDELARFTLCDSILGEGLAEETPSTFEVWGFENIVRQSSSNSFRCSLKISSTSFRVMLRTISLSVAGLRQRGQIFSLRRNWRIQ